MNKKAQGHIEVVISFVIFVGFVLFMFVLFNPIKTNTNPGLVDVAYLRLDSKLSVNIKTISVVNRTELTDGCFTIDNQALISDLGCNQGNIIVKNLNGEIVDSILSEGALTLETSNRGFYTIYCGDALDGSQDSLSNCPNLEVSDYKLGIVIERSYWSEELIESFISNYESDYDKTKEKLGVSGDFGFTILDNDENNLYKPNFEVPRSLTSYAKTLPIRLIDDQAKTQNAKVNVVIW
jgi:hypothetical protein